METYRFACAERLPPSKSRTMSGRVINNEKEATSEEPDFKDLKKGIVGDDEFRKSLRNSLGKLRARLKIKYEELFLSHFIRCKDSLN